MIIISSKVFCDLNNKYFIKKKIIKKLIQFNCRKHSIIGTKIQLLVIKLHIII